MKTALTILLLTFAVIGARAEDRFVVSGVAAVVNGRPITMRELGRRAEKDVKQFLNDHGNRREDPKVMTGARAIVRKKLWGAIHEALIDDYVRGLGAAKRGAWLEHFQVKDDTEKSKVYDRLLKKATVQILRPALLPAEQDKDN
jgi:hypothetical protein